MNDVMSAISSIGFPIVAAVACGMFIKWQYTENQKQISEMRQEHKEEVSKMTEAINNNTLVIQKLIDNMEVNK